MFRVYTYNNWTEKLKTERLIRLPITSKRLLFRRYNDDDFNFLMSLLSDPEVVRFIGNGEIRDKKIILNGHNVNLYFTK